MLIAAFALLTVAGFALRYSLGLSLGLPEVPVRKTAATVAAVLLSATLATGLPIGAPSLVYAMAGHGLCLTEDSPGCVWVAHVQGNQRGQTVVNGAGGAR